MIEAPVNRIKNLIQETQPKTRQERGDNYIETLQLALDTLRGLMASFNPEMQFKAVTAMLDFEKTRLRHNHPLAGMDTTKPTDWNEPLSPMPEKFEPTAMDELVDELDDDIGEPELPPDQEAELVKLVDETIESLNLKSTDKLKLKEYRSRLYEEMLEYIEEYGFEHSMETLRRRVERRKAETVANAAAAEQHPKMPNNSVLDWPD